MNEKRQFILLTILVGVCVLAIGSYLCGQDYESRVSPIVAEADAEIGRLKARIKELEDDDKPPPDGDWDVHVEHLKLLGQMRGFARSADTTGGAGGEVVVAKNMADLIRYCERNDDPLIILFDESADGQQWDLRDGGSRGSNPDIMIRANKTVWCVTPEGKPVDLTIASRWEGTGAIFRLNRANTIFVGLTIRILDASNDDAPDGWSSTPTSSKVWIYQCTGLGNGADNMDIDGFIDVYGRSVTVQDCLIKDWGKAILMRRRSQLTIWNTTFDSPGGRTPHCGDDAVAHVHRCTIRNWDWSYACNITERGTLYVTDSEFFPANSRKYAVRAKNSGKWHGYGNDFHGARTTKKTSSKVNVPYEF